MMNSLLTISIFVAMMLFATVHMQITRNCGPNEIETNCAPEKSCQPSCNEPNGTACPRLCDIHSCICKENFVRDNNNDLQCIDKSLCGTSPTTRSSKCGPNEVQTQCAVLQTCQPSCDNRKGSMCPMICSKNPCICKEGFIRHSTTDLTCVPESQCDQTTTATIY